MTAPRTTQPVAPGAAQPTTEQLQLAFRQLSRPQWPATLDAALAHPVLGVCLRALARQLGRPRWQACPIAPGLPRTALPPVPPTPQAPPPKCLPVRPQPQTGLWRRTGVDLKRLAANDHDDDD